jgi:peptidoglycan/LPS O-acetylase OafA/YrhL
VAWRDAIGAVAPAPLYIAACLAVSIACAFLIHRLIERPVTDFLQSRLNRGKSAWPWRPIANSKAEPRRVGL